jgi:hypothetical protein
MSDENAKTPPLSVNNLTLHWAGFHSRESKLLDEHGRNLFEILRVGSAAFEFNAEEPHAGITLHLNLGHLCVPGVKARLSKMDLARLAAEHGYRLFPMWPEDESPLPTAPVSEAGNPIACSAPSDPEVQR